MASSTVFISYRREDSAGHAGRLFDRLADRLGRDHVFRDVENIRPGEDFSDVIRRRIEASDVLFVLIGPRWLTVADADGRRRLEDAGDPVRLEIEAGLERKMRVIPVLLPGARMPKAKDLPPTLAPLLRLNAYEVTETHFDQDVLKLLAETRAPAHLKLRVLFTERPVYLVYLLIVLGIGVAVAALLSRSHSTAHSDLQPSSPAVAGTSGSTPSETTTPKPTVPAAMTPDQARDQLGRLGLAYNSDAFIGAAGNGDASAVSLYLKAGMRPDAGSPDTPSALMSALDEDHPEIARMLIENGADLSRSLRAVARNGNQDLFNLLLSRKPGHEALTEALNQAAESGHINLVKELLNKGISPNDRWAGSPPLEDAAYYGHTDIVRLLLDRGADPKAVDANVGGNGETALHYAARSQSDTTEITGLLLSAGAPVNAQDRNGRTPLMDAIDDRKITMMLLESGANVNLRDDSGGTALMYVVGQHLTDRIKLIVDKGADVNAQDKRGYTPLMFASGAIDSVDAPETVQAVIDNGARLNIQDRDGFTALMYAAAKGLNGTVRVLLAAGADRDIRNKEGKTALQLATANSEKRAVEMLKK